MKYLQFAHARAKEQAKKRMDKEEGDGGEEDTKKMEVDDNNAQDNGKEGSGDERPNIATHTTKKCMFPHFTIYINIYFLLSHLSLCCNSLHTQKDSFTLHITKNILHHTYFQSEFIHDFYFFIFILKAYSKY